MFWKRRKRQKAFDVNADNFHSVLDSNTLVFMFFKAPWCGACKILSPIVHDLADSNRDRDVLIAQVHTDHERDLVERFQIRSLPTLIVFEGGEVVYRGTGMISKPRLQEMINKKLTN